MRDDDRPNPPGGDVVKADRLRGGSLSALLLRRLFNGARDLFLAALRQTIAGGSNDPRRTPAPCSLTSAK